MVNASEIPELGWVVVGGTGANTYDLAKIAGVFDLGGDDRYRWGAAQGAHRLVVDLAGNDLHSAPEGALGPAAALGAFAALVLAWTLVRLPETLPVARRVPISLTTLRANYRLTLTNRYSVGYAIAASLTFGGIIAFVSLSQQIFVDEFGAGDRFTLFFAICACAMGAASFLNSRLVERLGTRLISQSAVLGLITLSIVHVAVIATGVETLWSYIFFQALSMTCIGLCGANFGAMAMEPVGHIAGTASSLQGFITSIGAVVVGSAIGQSYAGTTTPLAIGYLAIGFAVLGIIWVVEGGQLFRARMG